jgi:hypothetical protein
MTNGSNDDDATRQTLREELEDQRESLEAPFAAAKAKGDQKEMDRLTAIATDIDLDLNDLAIADLSALANRLKERQAAIEKAKKKATLLGGIADIVKPPQKPG